MGAILVSDGAVDAFVKEGTLDEILELSASKRLLHVLEGFSHVVMVAIFPDLTV